MPADLHAVEPHLAEALHSIKKDAYLLALPGRISREMQTVAELNVPLTAEAKYGKSWYEAK